MNFPKSIHLGRYSIPTLVLLATMVASVAAVAYVVLSGTITATVVANPKVCFYTYPNTRANTFSYSVNIFANVKTVDENMTTGIYNWDSTTHTTYVRLYSITNSANIALINLYVKTGADVTMATVTWNGGALPTTFQSFTAAANTVYKMWIEITASGSPTGSSVITVDMKVDNP